MSSPFVSRRIPSLCRPILALIGLAAFFFPPLWADSSESNPPRPWHIHVSGFAGQWGGAAFFQNFMLDSNQYMWLWTSGDGDESSAWAKARSQVIAGGSIGFSYDFGSMFRAYAEYGYLPKLVFPDGIEKEYQHYWDASQQNYVSQVVDNSQTARTAKTSGVSLGVIVTPFLKIPVGLDIKIGLWKYDQRFMSGTSLNYDGIADYKYLENRSEGRQVGDYLGQGKWSDAHSALLLGIGLKYFPLRWVSIDLGTQGLTYIQTENTGLVYVDSGKDVYGPELYGLGSMWMAGITVYF